MVVTYPLGPSQSHGTLFTGETWPLSWFCRQLPPSMQSLRAPEVRYGAVRPGYLAAMCPPSTVAVGIPHRTSVSIIVVK